MLWQMRPDRVPASGASLLSTRAANPHAPFPTRLKSLLGSIDEILARPETTIAERLKVRASRDVRNTYR
jgi:hypothetical protein